MPRISYFDYDSAPEEIQKAYDTQKEAAGGYVTNMKQTLLHSLPAYTALMQWGPLRDEVAKFIGPRGVTIFCHAISDENNCLLCSLYFRKEFADLGVTAENIEFSDKEKLLEEFGRQIARNPKDISDDFFKQLKKHFTEVEIVNLTAFATIMIATNVLNNALQIEIDENIKPYIKQ